MLSSLTALRTIAGISVIVASCNLPGPSGNAVHLQNGAVRIVDQANLAGNTPCSEGRGGLDRWCVFFKQKQTVTRGQDVWAVNVSRIGRGENIQCNQPGPACVSLAVGDHVVHWGFVADTLIIDGVPPGTSVSEQVSEPVTAWRPEWDRAVTVTSHPVSACWVDVATESMACVEQGATAIDAAAIDATAIDATSPDASATDGSAVDASAADVGTFYAGRLTQSRRALTVVPQGREEAQALAASDSLLVLLSPGVARVYLESGAMEVLPLQNNGLFGVTPDENWILWLINKKADLTGTHSLVAAAFPEGGTRHDLLENVLRHDFVQGPRAAGADVVAVVANTDGTNHLVLAGPNPSAAPLTTDLGLWTGTTTDKLDATSGDGYAVVADTQGTAVLSLLAPGPPCFLGTSVVASSEVLTVPSLDTVLWVDAAAGTAGKVDAAVGAAGRGYRGTLATCTAAAPFASSATSLEVEADRHLLYLDSAKHLLQLDLAAAGAAPTSMRDPDEVVYRWAYVNSEDLLVLEMTSVFDTAVRLYVLRNPFSSSTSQ